MPIPATVIDEQADRLDHLGALRDGWCCEGRGDAPTTAALTAAHALLAALPPTEQRAWHVEADPDGGVRFERDDIAPGAARPLHLVDVDRDGSLTLVRIDVRDVIERRRFTSPGAPAACGQAIRALVTRDQVEAQPLAA